MIKNKTIFISHRWRYNSYSAQTIAAAEYLSKNNKVIFFNGLKKGIPKIDANENLTVLEWPSKQPTKLADFLFLRKLMKQHKPDICLAFFSSVNFMMIVGWLQNVRVRIAYCQTIEKANELDTGGKKNWYYQFKIWRKSKIYKLATHFIAVTEATKADVAFTFKVPLQKITVLSNTVIQFPITEVPKNNTKKLIGFIGRYTPTKGVDILIEAFEKVYQTHNQIHLLLGGAVGDLETFKNLITAKGLTEAITFIGEIPNEQVQQFFSTLYLSVLPSRSEASGTVIIESFAAGTPVIGSNVGGIPEVITDAVNGLLFQVGNAEDLALKIETLLNNETYRNQLSANAKQSFLTQFHIATYPSKLEAIFIHALGL